MLRISIAMAIFSMALHVFAQDDMKSMGGMSKMDKLSQEMVNPLGPNWLINTYANVIRQNGDITDDSRTATNWLLQPVMPIPINKKTGLILMNRPAIMVFFDKPTPTRNVMGQFSGINSYSGVGDLTLQTALGKMTPNKAGKLMWGAGTVLVFPTASSDELGAEKYSAGPVVMAVELTSKYTYGAMLNHFWSYAGDDEREDISQTQFQLIYYKQLGNGWQIGDNPTWSMEHKAPSDEKYNLPIGLGIFKTATFMGSPWRFGITPRYFIKSNERWGNDWGVNFTITPVIKNPFM